MVQHCCVPRCTSKQITGSNISFHKIPHNATRRQQWLQAINLCEKRLLKNRDLRVCSLHFSPSNYVFGGNVKRLKSKAVPNPCPTNDTRYLYTQTSPRVKVQPCIINAPRFLRVGIPNTVSDSYRKIRPKMDTNDKRKNIPPVLRTWPYILIQEVRVEHDHVVAINNRVHCSESKKVKEGKGTWNIEDKLIKEEPPDPDTKYIPHIIKTEPNSTSRDFYCNTNIQNNDSNVNQEVIKTEGVDMALEKEIKEEPPDPDTNQFLDTTFVNFNRRI